MKNLEIRAKSNNKLDWVKVKGACMAGFKVREKATQKQKMVRLEKERR